MGLLRHSSVRRGRPKPTDPAARDASNVPCFDAIRNAQPRSARGGRTFPSSLLDVHEGDRRDMVKALELYAWNARIAGALMIPTHFAEVTTRNAVSDALTTVYGANWPWSSAFERSLPRPGRGAYDPRWDLQSTRARHATTGQVIADLKFVFWQKMFTRRHDQRLWVPHITSIFPNAPAMTPSHLRLRVAGDLDAIRLLRNRVAHHEPIFVRPLASDLAKMLDLVEIRCAATASWVRTLEEATAVIADHP